MLDMRQAQFFQAYQALSGSRNFSMSGPLPIPISEFESYCRLYKIHDVEIMETLHERIRYLDGVYLEHAAEQMKNSKK